MSAIRLITFDVTNTIIRVIGSVGQTYSQAAALYNKNIDPSQLDLKFRANFKRYNELYPNFGVNSGLTPMKWWIELVTDCFREVGSNDTNLDQIANHLYVYFSTSKGWEVMPNVNATLEALKERGIKIGVISNFDDRLETILKVLALRHYFDFVLSSAVVKMAKPNAEIFKMALKMADVKPEEALHVGDDVTNDYEGARGVGMTGVLFWNKNKQPPIHVEEKYTICKLDDAVKYF